MTRSLTAISPSPSQQKLPEVLARARSRRSTRPTTTSSMPWSSTRNIVSASRRGVGGVGGGGDVLGEQLDERRERDPQLERVVLGEAAVLAHEHARRSRAAPGSDDEREQLGDARVQARRPGRRGAPTRSASTRAPIWLSSSSSASSSSSLPGKQR